MQLTIEEAKKIMEQNNGNLNLKGSRFTSLPDNLTVEGNLDISYTDIISLPQKLTVVRDCVLCFTRITSIPNDTIFGGNVDVYGCYMLKTLPDNMTVAGFFNIHGSGITSLPENLTVGKVFTVFGTGIRTFPDSLKVGLTVDIGNEKFMCNEVAKVKKLYDGEYVEGCYLFANNKLTHVEKCEEIDNYFFYIGKIPGKNVISDGERFVFCDNLENGISILGGKNSLNEKISCVMAARKEEEKKKQSAVILYNLTELKSVGLSSEEFNHRVVDYCTGKGYTPLVVLGLPEEGGVSIVKEKILELIEKNMINTVVLGDKKLLGNFESELSDVFEQLKSCGINVDSDFGVDKIKASGDMAFVR